MTIMNKKNLILLVVLSNFAFAFGQDFNYFHNLTEQLQYSDCIAYKFYDYNSNSIDYSQGSLFRIPKNEDNSNFFAILGKGFVKIKSIETGKEYYTRAGHILFDEDYNLLLMPGFEFYHNESKKSINKIEISREGLLTICHCCPCCCLWKVYPNLDEDISNKVEKLDGITVKLHEDNCRLCKKCLNEVCMFQAIRLKDNKISIDYDTCKGCGLCTNACKFDAITIDYSDETIDNVINRMDNLYKKEL